MKLLNLDIVFSLGTETSFGKITWFKIWFKMWEAALLSKEHLGSLYNNWYFFMTYPYNSKCYVPYYIIIIYPV